MSYAGSQPASAKAKRDALVRELRTGRRIPAYEMISIAGLQYSRAVHELRWNVSGCVRSDCPKGLKYGLNIQNDTLDPDHPDHTVFFLAEGHWVKPVRGAKRNRAFFSAVDRDGARDDLKSERKTALQPTTTPSFPQFGALAKESYGVD